MSYNTNWKHLDKDGKVVETFQGRACFACLMHKGAFKDVQYLEYDFYNAHTSLTEQDLYRYFLFLKSIPEFAGHMPYDPLEMAQTKKATFDLTKINGLVLFAMLTVIRAVVEDPAVVKKVLEFDPTKEYSWTKLGILKACGDTYGENSGHWLHKNIHIDNVNYSPKAVSAWKSKTLAKTTGLVAKLHSTFEAENDGYMCNNPAREATIKAVLAEHIKPVVKKKSTSKLRVTDATGQLIVEF